MHFTQGVSCCAWPCDARVTGMISDRSCNDGGVQNTEDQ